MKEKTKAYMGGLLDGEGSLSITKSKLQRGGIQYIPCVGLSNCNPMLVHWAIKHFGGTYRKRERANFSDAASFEWYLTGRGAQQSFLEVVRPYVMFKKAQVDVLFEFFALNGVTNPVRREELHTTILGLHHNFSVETETLDPLSKVGRAYYAALLDGEGTITISKDCSGYFRPSVRVYNSNLGLLKPLQNTWGGSIFDSKGCWQWYVNSKSAIEKYLLYSLPYLLGKRKQAQAMLNFVRMSRTWNVELRNKICVEISRLNQIRVKIQSDLMGDHESAMLETAIA